MKITWTIVVDVAEVELYPDELDDHGEWLAVEAARKLRTGGGSPLVYSDYEVEPSIAGRRRG